MEQPNKPDDMAREPTKPGHVAMIPHAGDSCESPCDEPFTELCFGKIVPAAKFAELEACIVQHHEDLRRLLASVLAAKAPTGQNAGDTSQIIAEKSIDVGQRYDVNQSQIVEPVKPCRGNTRDWDLSDMADRDRAEQENVVRDVTVHVSAPLEVEGNSWICMTVQTWCAKIVHNKWFDRAFVSLIFVNFIFLLAEIQHSADHVTMDTPEAFEIAQNICTLAFLGELFIRIGCGPSFCSMIDRPWNIFDTVVVACSLIDWVVNSVGSSSDSAALSNIRVVRIVRVARVIRIVRHLRDLRKMIYSILQALSAVFWSFVLMGIVILLFAALLTQAIAQDAVEKPGRDEISQKQLQFFFGSISKSCLTLFESISGGLSWAEPMEHLLTLSPLYPTLFIFYIAICVFSLMNLITGIFCERVFEAAESDREQVIMEQLARKDKFVKEFQEVYDMIDSNGSGDLSLNELEAQLENERLQAYFGHLNISVARAWDIFKLLDTDGSGTVTIDEFVEGLVRLRGPAKVTDIEQTNYALRKQMLTLTDFMTLVDEELLAIKLHFGISQPAKPR